MEALIEAVLVEMQPILSPFQFKRLAEALRRPEGVRQPVDNGDLLELFLTAKEVEGCSPKTIAYYEATLQHMESWLSKPIAHVSSDDLRKYLSEYELERGSSKVTIDNIRRIFSSFFSWLEDEDYIVKSPVRKIKRVKAAVKAKETLSDEDLEALRDSCDSKRDLAMVDLLASTGMRVGELIRLDIDGGCGQKVGHLRGVRTEVRMYDRDTVELLLLALDEGMGVTRAAREVGVSLDTARRWAAGMLPRSCAAAPRASGRIGADEARTTRGGARVKKIEIGALYEPPETGPLAEMTPDQIEKLLLRAVLDDLKGGGSHPLSTPMRSRCELGERLRLATGLPTSTITRFLEIPRSTWYYHRSRPARAGRGEALRPLVGAAFEECGRRGYRAVHAQLRRGGVRVSEKVVRRLMREMGLTARRGRRRRWSSYAGETSPAPPNLPLRADGTHDFRAAAPNELWVTDITEFRLPSGARCYLSPVIDCFDGRPVAWSIGARPTAGLANSSLEAACATLAPGEAPAVHTDRGCHYRWPGWVAICEANGLARSMSRKGMSCDNARAEGFFGLLKQEFYYARDWRGAALGEFMGALDSWMRWFRSGRISQGLGWMTPDEYRASLRRPV